MSHNAINDRLRVLYTAVAWAQHPDTVWSAEFGQQHLRFGVTPRVVAEWSADGWDPQVALRFQQQFASREVANRWRADGQQSLRAAESAGRGEVPDEDARWVQAGFTPAKSARWRRWSFDPTEAYEWDSHNVAPSMVEPLGRQAASPNGVPVDVVKHWCTQGIPCTDVLAWVHQTNQDLDAALVWKDAKVRPNDLPKIRVWNAENPRRFLSAALIKPYAKAGVPSKAPELISQAIDAGITASAFKSAVDSLHEGGGGPLMEALRTRSATPGIAQSWLFRFDDPRFDDYGLRAVRSGQYPVLAKFVLDWLQDERFTVN